MSTQPFITGAVVLGGYGQVATWRRKNPDAEYKNNRAPVLMILQSEASEDGVLSPARDVTIVGIDALRALRSAIDKALEGLEIADAPGEPPSIQRIGPCHHNGCTYVDDKPGPGATCSVCGDHLPF